MKLNKSQYPLIGSVIALILVLVFINSPEKKERAVVKDVIDGDTFVTESGDHVRIWGINAPEGNECYNDESRNHLISLIQDKEVILERGRVDIDNYGRKGRFVFINDSLVDAEMLRGGYARRESHRNLKYEEELESAAQYAQENALGLWSNCEDFTPVDYTSPEYRRETDSDPQNEECRIKGNISEAGFGRVYIFPGCPSYNQVKIDTSKGEQYFCSAEEAEAAGFRRQSNCPF
ncbi:MAG: thermonuclease family protein [Candidatus Paceibacterota bacterium]